MGSILVIGAPAWGIFHPFYSVAAVAQIARGTGWGVSVADINIEFYNAIEPAKHFYWDFDSLGVWLRDDFVSSMFAEYRDFFVGTLTRHFHGQNFSIIAFSVNNWTRAFSQEICAIVREISPNTKVLFGGVACYPGEMGTTLLTAGSERSPDIILMGEAEIALPAFLEEFGRTQDIRTKIAGFAYLDEGVTVENGPPEMPVLRDIKTCTTFQGFPLDKYASPGDIPSHLSRGCIYKCHFCSEFANNRLYRFRRAEDVVDELVENINYFSRYKPVPHVYFADSLIDGKMSELEKFCDLVIERGVKFTWGGQAHFRDGLTLDFLKKMYRSGCREFLWGFESGSQRVVDLMNKRYDLVVAERILRECWELGMSSAMPVMVGYPGEEATDVIETMNFISRTWRYCNYFPPNAMAMLPNSPISVNPSKYGIGLVDMNHWETADGKNTHEMRSFRRVLVGNAVRGSTYNQLSWLNQLDFTCPSLLEEIPNFIAALRHRFPDEAAASPAIEELRLAAVAAAEGRLPAVEINTTAYKEGLLASIMDIFHRGNHKNDETSPLADVSLISSSQQAIGFIDNICGVASPAGGESIRLSDREFSMVGWAGLPGNWPADGIVVNINGKRFLARYGLGRSDVARVVDNNLFAVGFSCFIPVQVLPPEGGAVTVEAVDLKNGVSYPIANAGQMLAHYA